MNPEENILLKKLHDGDIAAMEVLYIRYAPQIKRFASSFFKKKEDAEDLVQEVFLKVWDEQSSVSRANDIRAYLYIMTRNLIYNKLKHECAHERFVIFSQNRARTYNPEDRIVTKDLLDHIKHEMDKLTEQQKLIYGMSRDDGMTYKEISHELGISPKTVQYHISNVLARLKKLL